MALPIFIKYIYNTSTEESIRRGKKIYSMRQVEFVSEDPVMNSVSFRVKDDTYQTFYKVKIEKYNEPKLITLQCGCPYNISDLCKHEVAALMQLQDLYDNHLLGNATDAHFDQTHTVIKMKAIDLKLIRFYAGVENYDRAEEILRVNKCAISYAENERVEASLDLDGDTFHLIIQKNEDKNFDTSCTCGDTQHALCTHKTTLFLQLLNNWGANYFDQIRNWTKEKNKLLESYGYNLEDDLDGKFEFIYKEGKPILKVLDHNIKKTTEGFNTRNADAEVGTLTPKKRAGKRIAVVFNANQSVFPYLSWDLVSGNYNEEENVFENLPEKIDLSRFVDVSLLGERDKQLIQTVRKMQPAEINKYLNRNSPFSGFWENIIHTEDEEYPEETKLLIAEYLYPKLRQIFGSHEEVLFFYLPKGKKFINKNLLPLSLSDVQPTLEFRLEKVEDNKILSGNVRIDTDRFLFSENEWQTPLMFLNEDAAYLFQKFEESLVLEKFKSNLIIPSAEWPKMLSSLVLPLSANYHLNIDKNLLIEVKDKEPDVSVQLVERGDYLVFQVKFKYHGWEVSALDKETVLVPEYDKIISVKRNMDAENRFIEKLAALHSHFIRQSEQHSLILKGLEVLRNNWFFLFIDAMNEWKVPVMGFDALKNFRFNTARPSTKIRVSSGLDWFDARVELAFGNQKIGIQQIQEAISHRQSFVQLSDGTLGILPEEWLKKYALLFKVGEGKNNDLRLSKFHLSVIDELYEQRDEEELSFELDEKFERLKNFQKIPEVSPPKYLSARLRPYQTFGFQWLNYLEEVGWGGILADDMGLGKTVQALSMLAHFEEKRGQLNALVVCPTTLIYNWQNEIQKFTPHLSYLIHHGSARNRKLENFENINITITTYGTLRSDIQMFAKIPFDYVVLDESQAIKNPFSKVTRAAGLLNAKNKVCMSGTPLQNNTFDLYAQMNFLNPGLLGSVEFFRNEFSTPIDKFGEQEQKEHLRKLLYPFILRRTKEQVAKDLPEKTETILFCEMDKKQRDIYESYRMAYRAKILGTIDEHGVAKSQLTILQGLMKLRQICDSPAILKDESLPNVSIKMEELTRELEENMGEHKALVFSQYLGMLSLIKDKLVEQNIEFEYFDGSTPTRERERAIQNFQNNSNCRVFLISLKAGGVGLNLTAADYVYIVDPWWNPAVEQQAIDRTHRIGQTKNIFAYRMICKDTIEDKILQLQERKRTLAKELISDDQSFVKGLTKEDVEYLFS